MSDTPRVGLADDADRYLRSDQTVWFQEPTSVPAATFLAALPEQQRFAVDTDPDAATYAAIYGVYPLDLAVPGPAGTTRQVPCAGLTWVGVHPDHRRRGLLTAMLRHHFEQVRETPGTHVSALHASEPAIYGRHGYGLASRELEVTIGRGTTLTAPGLDEVAARTTTRMHAATDAGVTDRVRACQAATAELGAVVAAPEFYAQFALDVPEDQRGKEPWRVLLSERDGVDVGFAILRRTDKWEHARPAGTAHVWTVAGDPATRLALWRRLLDLDLIGSVTAHVGLDDPVLQWVGGPRGTSEAHLLDNLWVRLVDLPEALTARTWSASCDVVVEVEDAAAPWNAGRWRLHADGTGEATVERTEDDADLRLAIQALGAAYLGGSLLAAARAGLVEERVPGAAAELSRALRTDLTPTAATGF